MPGIAVIQLNRLGDLHQTLPVLRGFEKHYAPEHLVLICCDEFAAALPDGSFAGQKVILTRAKLAKWNNRLRKNPADLEAVASLRAELPECLKGAFDRAINLTQDEPSASLLHLLHAHEKRGRLLSPAQDIVLADDWSKYLFAMLQHRRDNLYNLVDIQLGIAGLPFRPFPGEVIFQVSAVMAAHASSLLDHAWEKTEGKAAGPRPKTLIAVQLGASTSFRALGPKRFAKALNAAKERHDFAVLCVGTAAERKLGEAFAEEFKGPILNLQGETNLEDLPAVLSRCRLLLSNDTGTLHVAASVGVPTLGLFFATAHFSETAPYGAGHTVLQAALPCSPCSAAHPCPVQVCRHAFEPDSVGAIISWLLDGRAGLAPGPFSSLELYCSRFTEDGSLLYEPAPGWPVSPAYQRALSWREFFKRRLAERAAGIAAKPSTIPLSSAHLEELASALDAVAEMIVSQSFTPENPLAHEALTRLIAAEKACGPWGHFVAFDRNSAMTHQANYLHHRKLARETRAWLRESEYSPS